MKIFKIVFFLFDFGYYAMSPISKITYINFFMESYHNNSLFLAWNFYLNLLKTNSSRLIILWTKTVFQENYYGTISSKLDRSDVRNRLNSKFYQFFHISKVILFGRIVHKSQKLNFSKSPPIYYFYNKMIITGTKIRLLQSILLLVRS